MSIEKSLYNLKMKILKCNEIPHYLQEGIANDIHLIEESVRAKNNESLHDVSDTLQNCTACCRGVFINKKCNYCGADKLM